MDSYMVNGGIINIRNKEGGNAVKRITGKVRFEEQEKLQGWNIVNLKEFGEFNGEVVDFEHHKMYGWWYPSKEAARKYDVEDVVRPLWASISYVLDPCTGYEVDGKVMASDVLAVPWLDWNINLEGNEVLPS